ncbi:unnamed protein product [Eruca vesicaria subsp. sativa]|uniref:Uncharacterized protein n=1 Tax=Eruca vesicaria subsp. sativa TaxID=29727 RepID=A0ABC8M2J5_ERUVS|nr:unnamed protein product [Eruca vesicaria subsp. sativa]
MRPPLERNLAITDFTMEPRVPTTEEVMNNLREATYRYANMADPKESPARRQRVLSDEEGLREATAEKIIATASRNVEEARIERSLSQDLVLTQQKENANDIPPPWPNQEVSTPTAPKRHCGIPGWTRRMSANMDFHMPHQSNQHNEGETHQRF